MFIYQYCLSLYIYVHVLAAKDLIKNLLKTNPQERIKIDGALRHPWIASYQKVPETPLASCYVLKDEAEVWGEVQVRRGRSCER